jgi:hypothetical protein
MRTPSCPPRPSAAPLLHLIALVAVLGAAPLLSGPGAHASGPAVVAPLSVSALAAAMAEYDRNAQLPLPRLTDAQRTALIRGEVVRVLDQPGGDPDEPRRATGLRVIPAPRDVVWVACQDPHYVQSGEVTEVRVEFAPPDRSRWYGMLDLPRPFADRHWLVDVTNNHSLAASTGNRAWEHPWRLRAGGRGRAGRLDRRRAPRQDPARGGGRGRVDAGEPRRLAGHRARPRAHPARLPRDLGGGRLDPPRA